MSGHFPRRGRMEAATMDVLRYPDPVAAAEACGQRILDLLAEAIAERKRATLAISGGSSPRPMFELFAKSGFRWEQVHIFWVDERCVPPCRIHRAIFGWRTKPGWLRPRFPPATFIACPRSWSRTRRRNNMPQGLRDFFHVRLGEMPQFDVIHRGMGPDAHTASLFPGEPLIEDHEGSGRRRVGGEDASVEGHAAARSTGSGAAHRGARNRRG